MSDYNDCLLPEPCLRMDTHFGDDYESVEFGDGTGYVKAVPMLAKLGALHVELDELRDENAKLRDQGARLFDKTLELGTENAKLRELVRDAWGNGHPDRSCGDCDIRDECHDDIERLRKDGMLRFSRCLFEQRIEERMRELGVEVSDDD